MPWKFNPFTGNLDLSDTTNVVGGSGDVVGPASATNNGVALFDTTTGKLIKDGGAISSIAVTAVTATVPAGLVVTGGGTAGSRTLAFSFDTGYSIPLTASQANWDTAFSERATWSGVSTNLNAATGRTSLGLGGLATVTPGTGIATALAIDVGTAGAPVILNGALGTPTSGTLTNCTGLPVASGISGLGTGVATFLATPSSANLLAALTDETGTGSAVFATSPTLVTPILGTPTSGTLTNCTGLPSSGISDFASAVRAQVESALLAGTNVTITPASSGATRTLTLAATGAGGAGTKTLQRFTPRDNQPPASNFATLDTRNSVAVLDFDDTTEESAIFTGVIPEGANLSSGIAVRIFSAATTATTGNHRWGVQFEKYGTDLDSDSFDTATEAHGAVSGTSGIETLITVTCTSIDSLTAGDKFRMKVYRDASDTTNDTVTGDIELTCIELRQVA